jgi:BASS family bile acid:Na+ symporter
VTAAELISLAIQLSMALIVLCVGMRAPLDQVSYLFDRLGLLARSLIAMNVIMPIAAALLAAAFDFNRPLEVALIALAVSPVPPILPAKEMKAGGLYSYVVWLLAITAALAIVFVPAAIELLGRVFSRPVHVPLGTVAMIVATSVLAPLGAGLLIRLFSPALAARIWQPVSRFATVLLVVAFVPVLVRSWPAIIAQIGNFTVLVVAAFVLIGLAAGHLLGGPDPDDRTVLALSTATRHPGVAIAIAHATAPDDRAVPAAILLIFLLGTTVSIPYVRWRRRVHAGEAVVK